MLLVSVLGSYSGYAVGDEDTNKSDPYPAEIMCCYLEQEMANSDGTKSALRDYGVDTSGSHKYEVVFSDSSSGGFLFNIFGEDDKQCNYGGAVNDFIPIKAGSTKTPLWKLTSSVASKCHPKSYDVVAVADGAKKIDHISMPEEIQVKLDSG